MNYSCQHAWIDVLLRFRTTPEAGWSLFSRLSATAGPSINANTESYYNTYRDTETRNVNSNNSFWPYCRASHFFYTSDNSRTEKFNNKCNFGFSTYIPKGIDFGIGNNREFWKRTHLFCKFRTGINFTSIPEFRSFTNDSLHHGLGLEVSW